MKRYIILIITMLIMISMIGCTSNDVINSGNNERSGEPKEITIITQVDDIYKQYPVLSGYISKFEIETGVRVKIDLINSNTYEDYISKLNVKLYSKEGPTLIHFSDSENYSKYIDNGVALNIKGRIPNYDKVYEALKYKDCFIPIGMSYTATILNKNVINELNIDEPSLDWTKEEYLDMKSKWLNKEPRYFNCTEYRDVIENPLYDLGILDMNSKKVFLNNEEVKDFITEARKKIFSDKYIINTEYSYMDYYKMFHDYGSTEYFKAMSFDFQNRDRVLKQRFGINGLKSLVTSSRMKEENILIRPRLEKNLGLSTWGFIINRNGKNTDLAIKFLNGLLSDETQLLMFNRLTYGGYPVNKNIERAISRIESENEINKEAIELRKYILEKIENGEYRPYRQFNTKENEFYLMVQKDLLKFIFSDEAYTHEELTRELQKLENKYNMWLNE